jgi:two-component system sensor histidine kinase BaeS
MRSITVRFMLAFVAVSVMSTALVVILIRWRSREEFRTFLIDQNRPQIVVAFSDYYLAHGSWQGISGSSLVPHEMSLPAPQSNPGPFTLVDSTTGRVVMAGQGYQLGSAPPPEAMTAGIPIQAANKTVGFLIINRPLYRIGEPGAAYLDRFNLQVALGGLIAVGLALILAVVLARTLTRPIRELTAATQVVSGGSLGHQVPVRSRDELGQLASSFNRMSADLVRSLHLRRQMTADIAHELRTPISVILGHAEAVHDGVLPASPETFEIIREEAGRLEHLVDDLRTLSMADAGELKLMLRPSSPRSMLLDVQRIYAHRATQQQISLQVNAAQELPEIQVDPQRIKEVFANVLENALRYSPAGGMISLSALAVEESVEFRIQDSGHGLAASELSLIFERFHRVQNSRTRDEGGSGLGLAIAKSIVEKHQGSIWAESEPGRGLTIAFRIPFQSPTGKN